MFKKLLSSLAALGIGFSILFAGTPANALPDQTQAFPIGDDIFAQSVLKDNSVFAWGYADLPDTNERQIIGYKISPDGTLGSRKVFETFSNKDYSDMWIPEFVQTSKGTLVFGWSIYVAATRVSYMKISTSRDGVTWSNPVSPVANFIPAVGKCPNADSGYAPRCGYGLPNLAEDGTGRVGIAFNTFTSSADDAVSTVSVVTSTNLTSWTKPVTFKPDSQAGSNGFISSITGLPSGGFGLSWQNWLNSSSRMGYGVWLPGSSKIGSVVTTPTTGQYWTLTEPAKVGATKFIQFFNTGGNEFSRIGYVILDTKAKKWSAPKLLTTVMGPGVGGAQLTPPDIFGDVSLIFQSYNWSPEANTPDNTKYGIIRIPAGKDPAEPLALDGREFDSWIVAASLDESNNPAVYKRNFDGQLVLSSVTSGALSASTTQNAGNLNNLHVQIDHAGNPSVVYRDNEGVTHWQRIRSDRKPSAKGFPMISGKAKSKGVISVSNVSFAANAQVSANAFQWYSCESAVNAVLINSVPNTCTAIPGAIGKTYRIDAGDVGQYLAVTVSNTNAFGTTHLLSKSTSKVARK